jgi:membrane AbrB-like protein
VNAPRPEFGPEMRYSVARALTLCCATGAGFSYLGAPLPWMIGPLLAMACGRFFGAHLAAPRWGRALGQLVIGCALGLYFTPPVALEIADHWPFLIAAGLFAVVLAYASAWFLTRSANLDGTTALFSSVPGGAAEMTVLGERFGARLDRVVLAQSLRVMLVVVTVPLVFAFLGLHGVDTYQLSRSEVSASGLAGLLAGAAAAGALFTRLRVPNSWMLGPLAVSIACTLSEVHLSAVPAIVSNAAQVFLGCALGAGFDRNSLRSAPRFIVMVLISIVLAMILSGMFAWAMAVWGGFSIATAMLATAPGGMAEMCITAKVLRLGVPLVTAAHLARVVILVTTTGPTFRIARYIARGLRR